MADWRSRGTPGTSWVVSDQTGSFEVFSFPRLGPKHPACFSFLLQTPNTYSLPEGFLASILWSCISLATPFFVTLEYREGCRPFAI